MLEQSAVFFDIDDTLLDNYCAFRCTLKEFFPDLSADEDYFKQLYCNFRRHSEEIYQRHLIGKRDSKHRYDRWLALLEALGKTDSNVVELEDYYHVCQSNQTLTSEMRILLQVLKKSGVLCGVLTNGFTNKQQRKLEQLEINRFIKSKWQFISESFGDAKPNVSCFQKVAVQLPDNITQIFYLGDSFKNDIIPAHAANWKPIWLNQFDDEGELLVPQAKSSEEAVIILLSRLLCSG